MASANRARACRRRRQAQPEATRARLLVVHVNGVLRRFREDGILTVQSRRVAIDNLAEMVRLAEPLFDTFEKKAPELQPRAA